MRKIRSRSIAYRLVALDSIAHSNNQFEEISICTSSSSSSHDNNNYQFNQCGNHNGHLDYSNVQTFTCWGGRKSKSISKSESFDDDKEVRFF